MRRNGYQLARMLITKYVPSGTGFKEQESILGFRRIRSENSSGSSSFSSRSLQAKRRRKPACTASFPSYDGASLQHLASGSSRETDHRLSYCCRTGRAQGSLGYCAHLLIAHLVPSVRTLCEAAFLWVASLVLLPAYIGKKCPRGPENVTEGLSGVHLS